MACCKAAPAQHATHGNGSNSNERALAANSNGSAKIRPSTRSSSQSPDPEFDSFENMPGGGAGDLYKGSSGSLPGRYSSSSTPQPRGHGSPEKEPSKKWSFGGLFRRKEKPEKGKIPLQPSASVPITIQFEPNQRPKPRPPSESESESSIELPIQVAAPVQKQSFISRKLSGRSKKSTGNSSKKGVKGVEGQVSANNGNKHGQIQRPPMQQSWETTKKQPALLMPPNGHGHGMVNYSSSGSLSLSVDGSSLSRGSRAAAREATKARAAARRESYFEDTSSSSGGEEGGSFQGSHSSLSSRNRRYQHAKKKHGNGNGNGTSIVSLPANSSPNLNRVANTGFPPSSPRWEARVIYTKETFGENDDPVVVKLPRTADGKYIVQPTISQDQQVITAGLKVPILMSQNNNEEPVYANLPLMGLPAESPPPPPPPRREFPATTGHPNFYRPMSCSYLDSYNNPVNLNQQNNNYEGYSRKSHHFQTNLGPEPQSLLNYEAEPKRLKPTSPSFQRAAGKIPEISILRDSPKSNGVHDYSLSLNPNGEPQTPTEVSKLGFPVRKLTSYENMDPKLPATQSPVHSRASEFWRRKEQENGVMPPRQVTPTRGTPSPQKLSLSRIRSADSSPTPVPKISSGKKPHRVVLNSNESISSLSSFSVEAPSASPNIFSNKYSSNKIQAGPLKPRNLKSPDFKITPPNQTQANNKENGAKSACERLQVRFSAHSPSPTPSGGNVNTKTPKKNLEEALNELEDMYKSLRLSDEDLLDRAERRDLPTPHQELRDKDPIQVSRFFRFTPPGSLESLATTSGSGGSSETARYSRPRQRAPPMRRSCRPDLVNDDMAKRKYESKDPPKPSDPRDAVSQGQSYLVLSPAFSPPASPCPPDHYPFSLSAHDPDLTTDDVTVRNYKRANAIRIIEPQPPFGIPLGPITPAADSDYLHSKPVEKYRPLFRHVKNPDIVKDDIAFRNLRKDLNQENNLSKDWTPRLFSPLRGRIDSDNVFNYNIPSDDGKGQGQAASKKLRAIRSLSANISHLIPTPASPVNSEIGKWNSYSELHSRSSRSMTPVSQLRASTYMKPSWVQQANLDYEPPFLKKEWEWDEEELAYNYKYQPRKPPAVRTKSENYQSDKPRRPWTDIILDSFEKEKQKEIERQMAEAAEAQANGNFGEYEEEEVFEDASEITPRDSPAIAAAGGGRDVSRYSTPKPDFPPRTQFSLLNGQKNRRGSWVEPKSLNNLTAEVNRAEQRKSWSDLPASAANSAEPNFLIHAARSSPHFTPLPPPRRVKQISLEGFNPAATAEVAHYPTEQAAADESISPSRGELELNDLIDALVREADTCGPSVTTTNEQPTLEFGEELERPRRRSSDGQSINNLINSINQSLPELEITSGDQESQAMTPATPEQPQTANDKILKKLQHDFENGDDDKADSSRRAPCDDPLPQGDEGDKGTAVSRKGKLEGSSDRNGSRKFEQSLEKINYHPNSAFEVRGRSQEICSSSFPGVTKVSLPVWRMPQAKTLPLQAGFRIPEKLRPGRENENSAEPEKSSAKDKFHQSKLFPSWKNNLNDNKRSATATSFSKQDELNPKTLEKLSSSSSESGDKSLTNEPLTPVNKRDSISDSEGMSGLKRLLRKETSQNNLAGGPSESATVFGGIKKSPSAGSTSYWSRVSSAQPSFLKKFFPEKSAPPEKIAKEEPPLVIAEQPMSESEPVIPESVLSFNVAQKANMFMKLEHEQRFSKWHNVEHQNRPRSTRFSTQPVTTEEVFSATKALDEMNANGENPSTIIAQSSTIQQSCMSANADVDDKLPSGSALLEPSRLSLKDRVNMFNRMSTIPMAIIQSRPPSSGNKGSFGSNSRLNNCTGVGSEITNTGGLLSRSLNNDTDSSYDNLNGFMSDKNSNDLRRRRGSDSSIGMSSGSAFKSPVEQQSVLLSGPGSIPNTPPTARRIPVAALRNSRVKSLFIPASSDPDNLSEDGEISSGGQEVAEIISRSYENSPIFRKKSWRTQQPQPSFAKELWRKFGKVEEEGSRQWSGAPSTPTQYGFPTQDVKPISSPLFSKLIRSGGSGYPITTTSSSNLLPILTALSSSDDQLSEAKASANVPPIKPRRSNIRKILNQQVEMSKSQSLGKEESGEELTYQARNDEIDSIPRNAQQPGSAEDSAGFSSVKREGDLLVMKKHMPILRRKSSGKSRNPLKVLAARMDFRNQKYTETLLDSDPEHNARL